MTEQRSTSSVHCRADCERHRHVPTSQNAMRLFVVAIHPRTSWEGIQNRWQSWRQAVIPTCSVSAVCLIWREGSCTAWDDCFTAITRGEESFSSRGHFFSPLAPTIPYTRSAAGAMTRRSPARPLPSGRTAPTLFPATWYTSAIIALAAARKEVSYATDSRSRGIEGGAE
jgi:hypothetical protein